MSQLTAVTAVCTLKWLLLCSFCILLYLFVPLGESCCTRIEAFVIELMAFSMPAGWNTLTGIGDLMNSDDDSYLTIALKGIVESWKLWCFEICLLLWKQNISQKPTWFLPECATLGCLRVTRVQIRWFHVVFVSMLIGGALTVETETRFFVVAVGSAIRHLPPVKGFIVP